jgi:stalled ribosome alternative rescue factor ArfA
MDRKTIKQRNLLAKFLRDPRYRQRVVRSKVSYTRKKKYNNLKKENEK